MLISARLPLLHPVRFLAMVAALGLAACAAPPLPEQPPEPQVVPGYEMIVDGEHVIPAVPPQYLEDPLSRRQMVSYNGSESAGTIVVDPHAKFLYLVTAPGEAMRYRIAVGREGRGFRGSATVGRKAEWPYWTPTQNMIRTEPELYADLADGLPGGIENPLGARALYLYRNGRDTMFRIHGTNDVASIGNATSAGCIRLFNQDIIDLYERVNNGQRMKVRTLAESERLEGVMAMPDSIGDIALIEAQQ